jgi:hypothetical protein
MVLIKVGGERRMMGENKASPNPGPDFLKIKWESYPKLSEAGR